MNLLVKGTSGPLTGEVRGPELQISRAPRVDPGVARAGNEPNSRPLRRASRAVHDGRAARARHEDRSRRSNAARDRRSVSREAQGRLGRQLRFDALFHDRLGVARRLTDHVDRAEILPAPPGRTACSKRSPQMGVRFESAQRLSADRNRAGSAARRDDRHPRNACRNGSPAFCCSLRSRESEPSSRSRAS